MPHTLCSGCEIERRDSTRTVLSTKKTPLLVLVSCHCCYLHHEGKTIVFKCLVSCVSILESSDSIPLFPASQYYNLLDCFHCWQLALGYFSFYGLW